jgi:nucleotide-binding universal stress UspA family protein
LNEELEKRDQSEIVAIEKQLKSKGFNVTHVVKSGTDAAGEIIETCKKVGADMVVMSTHGRSGISSWAFGSVAEKLLRYGEIPLLLVNARAE